VTWAEFAGTGGWFPTEAGDRDSCHTVWFELHEDLLSTLGIRRGDEATGPP
jgi:hypothetical protein